MGLRNIGAEVMRQLVVSAGCVIFLLGLAGCRNAAVLDSSESAVEVVIKGGGEFPEFLVGSWKADKGGWEFVFEPDGTISSALIDSGMVRVTPAERIAKIELKNEGEGTYKLGQWTVQYSPDERELAVKVVVDYFHLDMRTFGLKGHSTDWFVGPVSDDLRTWQAEWFTFPKYLVLGPEPGELPMDPNDNPMDTLIFRKQRAAN